MVAAAGIIGTVAAALPLAGKLLDAIDPLLDRFFPDPDKKAELRNALLGELAKFDQAQLAVNAQEAAHPSIFVAGWRPFIGWVCGLGIAYSFIAAPLLQAIVTIWKPDFALPAIDAHLWELVFGLLGMGALRSFDKMQGSDTKAIAAPPRVSPTQDLGKSLKGVR